MVAKLTMARERILIDDWQKTLATAERADRQNQLTRKLTTVTAKGQHHNPPLLPQSYKLFQRWRIWWPRVLECAWMPAKLESSTSEKSLSCPKTLARC